MTNKILIIGNGYIGSRCKQAWPEATQSTTPIKTIEDVLSILEAHQPDVVLNAAGVTGKPNVDWCETHQLETIFGNTILPNLIAQACQQKNIYLLHIGSGCVFYGNSPTGDGWQENDFANPEAVYTKSKYAADLTLSTLPNVGIARIRMPLDNIPFPGNLIDKLAKYRKIIDVENSITVIPDMIKVFKELLEQKAAGIFHVTNPGSITHKQIMAWYKELVNPEHHNEWITEKDLVTQGLVAKKRSNNLLKSTNLEKLEISMRPSKEAVYQTIVEYSKNI